ncbi:DDE 3 domain containing protein [Asbolus verrucosus]|uniref:DDE 3 domain containing protein n=1 Tax=Asbolus verrucosus TaxID=1661398 RepID=A0A482W5F4_ASBVE|nr:DDE 3 domain containing protein [Asbolus verrucosus]
MQDLILQTLQEVICSQTQLQMLPWPTRSPDLPPIEHVWDMIGRRLRVLPRSPDNLHDLRHHLEVTWTEIL